MSRIPNLNVPFIVPYDRNDLYEYYGTYYKGVLTQIDERCLLHAHLRVSELICQHLVHADCWDIIERVIEHQAEG